MRNSILVISIILLSLSSYAQWGIWEKITKYHYVPDKILNFNGKLAVAARYNEISIMKYSYDIFLSDDNGVSWDVACSFHSTPDSIVEITDMAVSDSLLFMLAEYHTNNGQQSFKMFSLSPSGIFTDYGFCYGLDYADPSAFFIKDNVFFLGCTENSYGKVYKSLDSGVNWNEADYGFIEGQFGNVSDFYSSADRIYISFCSWFFNNSYGLYYSDNYGVSWNIAFPFAGISVFNIEGNDEKLFISTDDFVYSSPLQEFNWSSTGLSDIGFHFVVKDQEIFAGRSDEILRSHDNGQNWYSFPVANFTGGTDLNRAFYDVADSTNFYFISKIEDHLVIRKMPIDHDTISFQMNGISQNNTISILVNDSTIFEATADNGHYYTCDLGYTWSTIVNEITGKNINSFVEFDSLIFAATDKGLYYTGNTGQNWSFDNSLPSENIGSIVIHDGSLFAGTNTDIYYKQDVNSMWQIVTNNLPACLINYLYTTIDTLYACTSCGVYMFYEPYEDWFLMDSPIGNFTCMAKVGGRTFLSSYSILYHTDDYGNNWETNYFQSINYLTNWNSSFYLGADNGIFVFKDQNGGHWNNFFYSTDLPIYHITFRDSLIYASGHGGIYVTPITEEIITQPKEIANNETFGAFPVPFTSFINITLPQSAEEDFNIILYDSKGQKIVESLVIKSENCFYLDCLDKLTPGVYILTMKSAERTYTKKIVKF